MARSVLNTDSLKTVCVTVLSILSSNPIHRSILFSGIQDYICSQAAIDLGLESGLSRPVVLYLNGEYWGIYFLQEKMDERYLEDHFNTNLNHCMIVGNWYGVITHGLRAAVLR